MKRSVSEAVKPLEFEFEVTSLDYNPLKEAKHVGIKMPQLKLQVRSDQLTIHRFAMSSEIPSQVYESDFFTISKTEDEISIVCSSSIQLQSDKSEAGWSCLKVLGPLDFALTGILAPIATSLADAGISIFAISTYDTDYILVNSEKLELTKQTLAASGCIIVD